MRWLRRVLSGLAPVSFLLASLFFAFPTATAAQATRADSAAVLLAAAEAFQAEGRWEVAEALFHYISERFGDTPAGAQAVAALGVLPEEQSNRSAQVELMVWSATYGAWLGIAIPGALGAQGPEPYGVGLLLGGPGGFLGGRALARSRALSEGQVRAITFGSLWGTWQGFGLMELMDWGEKERCDLDVCWVEGPDSKDVFKAFVVGGLAGTVTGALLARKPISRGVATAVNFGALWGSWFGLAGGILVDLEGDGVLASVLVGGNAALLATARLAPEWNISRNRARLISIAGVIGGLAGAGMDLIMQPDDEKVAIGIPLAASIAGLVIGASLTSDEGMRAGSDALALEAQDEIPGMGAALLRFRDGRVNLGLPTPFPTILPVEGPRGLSFKPALGLTLLDARF